MKYFRIVIQGIIEMSFALILYCNSGVDDVLIQADATWIASALGAAIGLKAVLSILICADENKCVNSPKKE
jgi:hypothetical protein